MNILCAKCLKPLINLNNSYKCFNNHNYDLSSSGYLNLYLKKSAGTGDNPLMVKSRTDFLNRGYYEFLKDELIKITSKYSSLLDLGCGEGYYTSSLKVKDKVGIDLSKKALIHASKNDKTTTYILSSIFNIPFEDESFECVLTCFAPISKEIKRVLKKSGKFILVRPNKDHLIELKNVLYDSPYLNDSTPIEVEGLKLIKEYSISNTSTLNHIDLINLFNMTPYVNTTSPIDKEKLNGIESLSITFDFIISIYGF